jgi:hypothetical protein
VNPENGSRRQFLLGAGVTIIGAALCPGLLAELSIEETLKAAPTKMRGLMVDAARVPETLDYYRRVIEFCADWQMNSLHFRLADHQGTALRFATVPGLVTHDNAITAEELKLLAEYARSHGVDLIPELESFGHTGYITRSPHVCASARSRCRRLSRVYRRHSRSSSDARAV